MQLPFSAPRLPELNALSVEQRKRVLAQYAESVSARRLIRVIQLSMFVALALFVVALNTEGIYRIVFSLAAFLSIVLGIVTYRIGAAGALRAIRDQVAGSEVPADNSATH
jgi:hypothetical protein